MIFNTLNLRKRSYRYNALSWLEKSLSQGVTPTNSVVVLGYNNTQYHPKQIRRDFAGKQIIVYQLEQISAPDNLWLNPKNKTPIVRKRTAHLTNWYNVADTIWEYDKDNLKLLQDLRYGAKSTLKPITEVTPYIYPKSSEKPIWDAIFYGSMNHKRLSVLTTVAKYFNVCVICQDEGHYHQKLKSAGCDVFTPQFYEDLWEYVNLSKCVLNLHYYSIQEQVRISECVANGKIVLSESSKSNIYGDAIEVFYSSDDLLSKLESIIFDKHPLCGVDIADKYQ